MLRLFLFLALALQVSAQETMIREVFDPKTDTHIEVLALFTKPSVGGYFPVRVKVANNLQSDRTVKLDFECTGSGTKASSSFRFDAGPGKTVTRDILVPLNPLSSYGNSSVSVQMSGSLGSATGSAYSNFGNTQPIVLLSETLFTPNASTLDGELAKGSSSGAYRGGSSEFAGKFDPKQLPDSWLAFSGYDTVIMTDTDWSAVPPGSRNAILSWVRLGGQLIIYATGSPSRSSIGLPEEAGFGSIEIETSGTKLDPAKTLATVAGNPNRTIQSSLKDDFRTSWPLQSHFGGQTFRYGLFVVVLVIFGILVGPVNLFVFAKSGKRHKLFITTPIISLGASAILIVLIIVQDGFGGNGVRRILMEVRPDSDLNAAYLHQEQFSRTGVLTAARFTVETPSVVQPVAIAASRWARFTDGSGGQGAFNLQPEDGKLNATGDWFQSRSEHGHVLSSVVSTRGRIETTDTPGTFLSTFDFPIETLYYLDENGTWNRAEGITAGKRFTPVQVDPTMVLPALNNEANQFSARNENFLRTAMKRQKHFIAISSSAPGIATNPGINWKETRTVITGPVVTP